MEDTLRELPPLMRMPEPTEEERAAMAPELEEMARQYALAEQEAKVLTEGGLDPQARPEYHQGQNSCYQGLCAEGLDPHKSLAAFASAYFDDARQMSAFDAETYPTPSVATYCMDDARQTLVSMHASAPSAPQVSVNDPNIWSEDKVREYLGFAPYPADDGFWAFAEAFLEEVYPADEDVSLLMHYYFAEQFACGSVIPGVRALWDQWPTCNWPEFADWLAGSAPGMGSSRRDFLMAGGDFMRVWREVSALSRACEE